MIRRRLGNAANFLAASPREVTAFLRSQTSRFGHGGGIDRRRNFWDPERYFRAEYLAPFLLLVDVQGFMSLLAEAWNLGIGAGIAYFQRGWWTIGGLLMFANAGSGYMGMAMTATGLVTAGAANFGLENYIPFWSSISGATSQYTAFQVISFLAPPTLSFLRNALTMPAVSTTVQQNGAGQVIKTTTTTTGMSTTQGTWIGALGDALSTIKKNGRGAVKKTLWSFALVAFVGFYIFNILAPLIDAALVVRKSITAQAPVVRVGQPHHQRVATTHRRLRALGSLL
jgi:hypothetical protein